MHAIIIHGMGRTPLSMCLLAYRLRKTGIKTSLFAYSATFEGLDGCTQRLRNFIARKVGDGDFIVVTHSLGSVLIRAVLPAMYRKPNACFLLAPPTQACDAARRLASRYWYRILAGEIGQLLADQKFMSSLPIPEMPTKIYAGNAGLTGRYSPFGDEPNDGVLMVKETLLPGIPVQIVPSFHTFIMNNKAIAKDIAK
jgi:alpha-beta hydrolase superfamily lysophospholipase